MTQLILDHSGKIEKLCIGRVKTGDKEDVDVREAKAEVLNVQGQEHSVTGAPGSIRFDGVKVVDKERVPC